MARDRPHSPAAEHAARLLGSQIRVARIQRRWSMDDLAKRVGVTRKTLAKVEVGDLAVGLGVALEAAALTGVPLFHEDTSRLTLDADLAQARAALLPARVRRRDTDEVDDEF